MAFTRLFSSVADPDTHVLDPQQESLMSSTNDPHEHTATEADNKEAASELNEYKHICYIAKIDQPNHIDATVSRFFGTTIKKYKYELWIKQLEQDRQGFIYYELNVKRDQINSLHKRLQTNNNDRINVLKNEIMNGNNDGNIYENIRKYLQKIFDMYILLTKWWLYDTLGISKQLRFKMEKYIDHIVKIIYDTRTRIKNDNDAENKFKDEIDTTNEDKYSFHTLYVVQRPIYDKKVIKLVNHWALKLIGENKLMTIDFNTTSDADVGTEYSGFISIDHCTLNTENDSRYDILRKRAFFLTKDKKSKKYYSFKIICKINLKSNNYKNLICTESIGYLLERWYKYKKGIYNTVTNNCQHFVVEMLSIIDENKAQIIAKKMSVATVKGFMPYAVCVQHLFYNQEIKKSIAVLSKAMQQFHNTKKDRIQKRKIIHIIEDKYPQLSNNNSDYDSEHDSLESKVSELPNTRGITGDDDDMDDDTKMSNNSQVKPPILIDDSKKSEQIGTDHSIAINNEPSVDIIPIETEIAKWLREITAQEDTDFYGLYFKKFNDAGLAKKKNLKYIYDETISFDKICPKIPVIHEHILKDEISKIFVKNDDNIETKSNVNNNIIDNDNE